MKKTLIALMVTLTLLGCGKTEEQPASFETPVPSVEEIETSGNPFEETSLETDTETTEEVSENKEALTNTEKSYVLMPENSEFYWRSEKITGEAHEGLMLMKEGVLTRSAEGKFTGNFIVDMNEMIVLDLEGDSAQGLIDHLKNDDFFSVEKFPEASFTISGSEKKSDDTYTISGDLTIKGITNPITFEMKFINIEGVLVAIADINFDRTLWDIKYGSGKFFEDLGDRVIKDEIQTKVTLSFIPGELLE